MILATDEAYHKSPQLFGKIPIFVNGLGPAVAGELNRFIQIT
jgi:hypothetical protein